MDTQEKIEIINQFLPLLNNKGMGTLSGISDNSIKVSDKKKNKYKIIEQELERFELVIFICGRDNSTSDGMCVYRISPKGIDFVLQKRSISELYEKEKKQEIESNINIKNLIINKDSTVGKINQNTNKIKSLNYSKKKRIFKWALAIIGAIAAMATIYEIFIKSN